MKRKKRKSLTGCQVARLLGGSGWVSLAAETFTLGLSTDRSPSLPPSIATVALGILHRRDLHPLERHLAPLHPEGEGFQPSPKGTPNLGFDWGFPGSHAGYTDDYGYWSGDCATQGDIDDLLATTAALDSDVEGLQSEADGALSQCQANYYPQNCLGSHELEFDIQGDLSVGGPSDAVAVSISLPCGEPSAGSGTGLRVATARFPCAQQAIEATAGFVGWLAAKAAAIYVANRPIAAAATTMSEVGWLTAGLIAGAFTFGFTVGNYINCLSGG